MGRIKQKARAVAEAIGIPQEFYASGSHITVVGMRRLCVENHNGLFALSPDSVGIRIREGNLTVKGRSLSVCELTAAHCVIEGEILGVMLSTPPTK
ncbi:MAG: YabP/YqfC family sporulation protein [Clostridia bacterium]|nr:YabP/YqfC family sporulation protein [Clostridia bacterium]